MMPYLDSTVTDPLEHGIRRSHRDSADRPRPRLPDGYNDTGPWR
jgi:hypothetical protein